MSFGQCYLAEPCRSLVTLCRITAVNGTADSASSNAMTDDVDAKSNGTSLSAVYPCEVETYVRKSARTDKELARLRQHVPSNGVRSFICSPLYLCRCEMDSTCVQFLLSQVCSRKKMDYGTSPIIVDVAPSALYMYCTIQHVEPRRMFNSLCTKTQNMLVLQREGARMSFFVVVVSRA